MLYWSELKKCKWSADNKRKWTTAPLPTPTQYFLDSKILHLHKRHWGYSNTTALQHTECCKGKVRAEEKVRQGIRVEGYGHCYSQKWYNSIILHSYRGKRTWTGTQEYLGASKLKGQKHAGRDLLLLVKKTSMTLTQTRTATRFLFKKSSGPQKAQCRVAPTKSL